MIGVPMALGLLAALLVWVVVILRTGR